MEFVCQKSHHASKLICRCSRASAPACHVLIGPGTGSNYDRLQQHSALDYKSWEGFERETNLKKNSDYMLDAREMI
jgi:hypothetical protein